MKLWLALTIGIVACTAAAAAEDMHAYMEKTRELQAAGKFAEALERHLWFHDHALEHDPSQYGVRISFALADWKELADRYPPALEAMKEVRDRKAEQLRKGKGNRDLFMDVAALNERLGENSRTLDLFRHLHAQRPDEAKEYWEIAKPLVVEARAWDLAKHYFTDPLGEYRQVKSAYDRTKALYARMGGDDGVLKQTNENILVEQSLLLIELSLALDKRAAAEKIQELALKEVKDPRLESAVPSAAAAAAETAKREAGTPSAPE